MAKTRDDAGPPPEIAEAIENTEREKKVPADKLEKLKKLVRQARTLQVEINSLESDADGKRGVLNKLRTQDIPDFMNDIQVPAITVEKEGNMPRFAARRVPFYSANISSKWEEDQKEAAYKYLKKIGHDDLIKNNVSFAFPRGTTQKQLAEFIERAKKIKITTIEGRGKKAKKRRLEIPPAEVKKGVNGRTLTRWLKDQVELEGKVPDLVKIGGTVGSVAELEILE